MADDAHMRNLIAHAVMVAHSEWVPFSIRYGIAGEVLRALAPFITPAEQEPTDAEVEAAARMIAHDISYFADPPLDGYRIVARDALRAARRVRQENGAPGPASMTDQRIRALHAADADGNCSHCTRGRVYPVPAPCETVAALAGGGEVR